jgi:hypothetical protein
VFIKNEKPGYKYNCGEDVFILKRLRQQPTDEILRPCHR